MKMADLSKDKKLMKSMRLDRCHEWMKSIGYIENILADVITTGTGFRVGSKYIMTAFHVMERRIGNIIFLIIDSFKQNRSTEGCSKLKVRKQDKFKRDAEVYLNLMYKGQSKSNDNSRIFRK